MDYSKDKPKHSQVTPRIIIHGGAGNISPSSLPPEAYSAYRSALLTILSSASKRLSQPEATALDVASYAVTQLENNPLFNSGHGAVFTKAGTHELEASVMVSKGFRKRGVGVMGVTTARNPILLAREVLVRGEEDGNGVHDGSGNGGGAQGHSQLHGRTCDEFVTKWGLQTARPSYFFTRKSWVQHRRGLGLSWSEEEYQRAKRTADEDAGYEAIEEGGAEGDKDEDEDENEMSVFGVDETRFPVHHHPIVEARIAGEEDEYDDFVPQGTVGCVVLDSSGTLCAATSTGGMTNKLPGRIGDTPTLGAGFWAEEWISTHTSDQFQQISERGERRQQRPHPGTAWGLPAAITDCLPGSFPPYLSLPSVEPYTDEKAKPLHQRPRKRIRAVAMSGTGNGDSFLRVNAVRTAAAMARWAAPEQQRQYSYCSRGNAGPEYTTLQTAVTAIAGPGGVLEQSAEDRWETGEGQGGIIGIELDDGFGKIVFDYNCGGMFHAWVDDEGKKRFAVFQDEK